MAGNRILMADGTFSNPAAVTNRSEQGVSTVELKKMQADLERALREKRATEAHVTRLEGEYSDLKKAYDHVWGELNALKLANQDRESANKKTK